jgi:small subunit ribosomal protein S3
MGHKTHPLGFRLGITQEHRSFWYSDAKNYSVYIQEDSKIRENVVSFLEAKKVKYLGLSKILIHRKDKKIKVEIQTTQPGLVVGISGSTLIQLNQNLDKLFPNNSFLLNVIEITSPDQDAEILGDSLVEQLESRVAFRRAIKNIIGRAEKQNVGGIKVQISGRLNGAEIARVEWLREGRVPLQTLRADIDYCAKTAKTVYGILGVKVWLFRQEKI